MGNQYKITAPVLLIIFNRPDTTQLVFNEIKKARPEKLYVFADGPRPANKVDEIKCKLAKEIVNQVDWTCQLYTRYLETNLGCGPGPASAISWVFENEDRAIILEDDCVPAQAFFPYCNELLERYKYDTRIWLISGDQYSEEAVKTPHSYFFSRYGHSQGWATWKRCWAMMDITMYKYPLIIEQDLFKAAYRTKQEMGFFKKKIDKIYHNIKSQSHTWDFQFGFAITSNGGLSIVPRKNLVKNIGYLGTHSVTRKHFHDRIVDENFKINSHPDFILCDVNYDTYHFKHYWKIEASLFKRIIRKVHKLITRWYKN